MQVLYLCDVGGATPAEALDAYMATHEPDLAESTKEFAAALVVGATAEQPRLDALIQEHSRHWRLERLAILDRLILRMATWELLHEPDVPAAVVLDEAIELARTFSTDDSVRFVNGVLDGIRQTLTKSTGQEAEGKG